MKPFGCSLIVQLLWLRVGKEVKKRSAVDDLGVIVDHKSLTVRQKLSDAVADYMMSHDHDVNMALRQPPRSSLITWRLFPYCLPAREKRTIYRE
jgi:hypothetical protein